VSAGKGMKPEAGRNLPVFRDKWEIYESKRKYKALLNTGMFFELFPDLTGTWEDDREQWLKERSND